MISTPTNLKAYHAQLRQALDNRFLGQTLDTFFRAYRDSRPDVFQGLDFAALAQEIGQAKDQCLPRLMELYGQFKAAAEAKGVTVHLAADAAQANEIIAAIGRQAGARKVVKAKSMTAEETFLNDHLTAQGFQVTETDLGEWIIQQRDEGPSHMVMPAIHLSRGQVAQLFGQVTGQPQDPDDIGGMVGQARRLLRQAFLEADMGVSGANFAIADSGVLGLVSNEGNARLVTTLPPVHVALVGLDKLLPDLGAALKILRILPKNATGQAISTYVSWIGGAVDCAAAPGGRKQTHVVFLDNGRLALARDPRLSQALRCVRCGACANVCPIYRQVGGHNYGHVYIGAIGLVLTLAYHGRDNARAIVRNCLNCGACKEVCAAGIDLPRLIKQTMGRVFAKDGHRPLKNHLLALAMADRRLFHGLLRAASLAQAPLADKAGMLRHLPMALMPEHQFRALPAIVRMPLRDRWPALVSRQANPRLRVGLFAGCLVDFVYPRQAEAFWALMSRRGVAVDLPLEQSCCGLPLAMAADRPAAAALAKRNVLAFAHGDHDHIVTLCASCASHLRHAYPDLLADSDLPPGLVDAFCAKIIDASSFLLDKLDWRPAVGEASDGRVTYHAPCHLCRGLGVRRQPKELLARAGLSHAPAQEEDVCCGFGGSYSLEFPELSARILANKLDNLEATGAAVVVTDCPGCVLQLAGGLNKRGSAMKAAHIVEALAGWLPPGIVEE